MTYRCASRARNLGAPRAVATFLALAFVFAGRPLAGRARPLPVQSGRAAATAVEAYVTTADRSRLLAREHPGLRFSNARSRKLPVLAVDDTRRFQRIAGFGAALTGSSAHLLAALPDRGQALLSELFRSDSGIGLSYVRLTVGASDFSPSNYTYDDVAPGQTDPAMNEFSIAPDAEVLSVLASIHATSHDVAFMASPWTAPVWMKTRSAFAGGTLLQGAYAAYARYFVAYLRALRDRGIRLDALTPQNEPLFDSGNPAMTFTAAEEADFVKTALGPELNKAFPATKLVVFDGNWDQEAYPRSILADPDAARFVAGSAFHCYAGDVSQMSELHSAYPEKAIYLSECGGGNWAPDFAADLSWEMRNLIIGGPTNWACAVVFWNIALNDSSGPTNHGCTTCRGVITIHSDGSVSRNVEYYALAHVAKFVRPGAVRLASWSSQGSTLPNVAFSNKDGSKVLVALNDSPNRDSFIVRAGNRSFPFTLPAGAVVTFRWK